MLRQTSLHLLLLTFQHLQSLHSVDAVGLSQVLGLHLEKVSGHLLVLLGTVHLRGLLLKQMFFVELAH